MNEKMLCERMNDRALKDLIGYNNFCREVNGKRSKKASLNGNHTPSISHSNAPFCYHVIFSL